MPAFCFKCNLHFNMAAPSEFQRLAFSPREFAALFGKEQTWGYRQLYQQKVKAIKDHGRILIPASEVERILATAGVYNGMDLMAKKTKGEIQKLAPKLKNTWAVFLTKRRSGESVGDSPARESARVVGLGSRKAALHRLTQAKRSGKNPSPQKKHGKLSR